LSETDENKIKNEIPRMNWDGAT